MTTSDQYRIDDPDSIHSPGLVFFPALIRENIEQTIRLCGGPDRIRPHFKTHKTAEIARMQLDAGITRHKCATIAEAEILASAGAPDILIAYQLLGPNIRRLAQLMDSFPDVRFATLIDHADAVEPLSRQIAGMGRTLDVMLDLNTGMDRTGSPLSRDAIELYEMIATAPGLHAAGLHWYDGHHHQPDLAERKQQVLAGWEQFTRFRDQILLTGLEIPSIVSSGTGSFNILSETGEPNLVVSPGTTTLSDATTLETFPELPFRPAALLLTRVISRPGPNRLTLDLGHKAVSADKPLPIRARFPALPDARLVSQHEEHSVIETAHDHLYQLGDHLLAIPGHVCPSVALHHSATIVENGQIVGTWEIAARNRMVSV